MNASAPTTDVFTSPVSPLPTTDRLIPAGVGAAIAAPLTILLDIPPLIWHIQNRNTAAASLVSWTILTNIFTFMNLLIWPTDDFQDRYVGQGLCDVQVKFMVARAVAFPAATLCIVRSLANVMNTDKPRSLPTKAQRARAVVMDLVWCVGLPLIMMLFHFIVQPNRYFLAGVSGCTPSFWGGWVSILLVCIPPLLLSLANAYYACLVIYRLKQYGSAFRSILASSNTTKSRFFRLYLISLILTLALIPTEIYILHSNLPKPGLNSSFHWSIVHDPHTFQYIVLYHSTVFYDRWVNIAIGLVLFLIFGMGRDAKRMYRRWLRALGLGRFFPGLYKDTPANTRSGTQSSENSKARLFAGKGKRVASSSTHDSTLQSGKDVESVLSPTKSIFSHHKSRPQNQGSGPFMTQSQTESQSRPSSQTFISRLSKPFNRTSSATSSKAARAAKAQEEAEGAENYPTHSIKLQDQQHYQREQQSSPSTRAILTADAWSDHANNNNSGSGGGGGSQEVLAQKGMMPASEVLVRKEVRRGSESILGA